MQQMVTLFGALSPVFALVLLGYLLRRIDFPGAAFWPLAERFTYYLLFPSLLVNKLATTALPDSGLGSVTTILVLQLLLASLLALGVGWWARARGAQLTSFFQGSVRFNTYVGLAAAVEFFGSESVVWAAVFIGISIPLVNVLCVSMFTWALDRDQPLLPVLSRALLGNPLIIGSVLGLFLNISGMGLPLGSGALLALLSPVALPLGLLAVGVGLDFQLLRRLNPILWLGCGFKLILYPLLFWLLNRWISLPDEAFAVLLLFACLPTAPSAYILARQLGGDAPLMASMITLQTLLAFMTVPLMLAMLA